jgi:chromosome segregation ATPase
MRTLAANWEAEVAGVRNDNLELHSLLRGAQAQQSQAEERARTFEQKAKEADDLKAALDAKVAALAVAEDQLLQERTARQGAEGQLQQERAALADARSVLEQERVAREAAQKSLEGRNTEFSKLEGELMVLGITSASQELVLQEQGETLKDLEQAVEVGRRALEVEKKQVEGKLLFVSRFSDPSLAWQLQACAPRWGTRPSGLRRCRPPTTPLSKSCWSCALRPSRPARP